MGVWIETEDKCWYCELTVGHTLRGCVDWNWALATIGNPAARHTLRGCVDWNTKKMENIKTSNKSHPSWVCGLKLLLPCVLPRLPGHTLRGCVDWNKELLTTTEDKGCHTLRGCVDWNSNLRLQPICHVQSHPSWVCGLKLPRQQRRNIQRTSHPSWVCGLKHKNPNLNRRIAKSHPSWVCGLKRATTPPTTTPNGHTLRGCVDWNRLRRTALHYLWGHTLRGCVDWNLNDEYIYVYPHVTPFVGVWIETKRVCIYLTYF